MTGYRPSKVALKTLGLAGFPDNSIGIAGMCQIADGRLHAAPIDNDIGIL